MPTDSERFAFTTWRHHAFASTGNAYDATQCDEAIRTGDTLIVLPENVVGVAMTWPFAVTQAHGNLHALSAPRGAETLAIRDVVAGFIVIGLMCAASVFSFRRLEPLAGAHLNGAKQSDDE